MWILLQSLGKMVISRDFMNGDFLVICIYTYIYCIYVYIYIKMYNLFWGAVEVTFMSTKNVNC